MGEDITSRVSEYIGKKFNDGMVVSAEILNAQKMEDDQLAPPYRMSPYVALAFYTRDWSDEWSDDVVNVTKENVLPELLTSLGKQNPRQEMIFLENEKYYLEEFKRMKHKYENNKSEYREVIESEINKSDIYPYKGQLRPRFRKEGLISEIEWAVDKLIRRTKGKEELTRFYHKNLDEMMFYEYPHE